MKFFIDTADVNQIREAESLGILDGVTTNPTLISKTGRPFEETITEICSIVNGPVSAEVVSTDVEGILQEARTLAKIAENIVIKIPLIKEGLKAVKILTEEGIRVNVTLCFSSNQALLAAKVGATYISPFVGRLDDKGHTGMDVIEEIRTIYDNYGFETQIIVASIRTPLHVRDAALMGADIATIPFDVFNKIVQHPLTDDGLKNFLADWEKVPK
ncbi:MAG: fructose-6-phosphate aldolase [Planctomycetes bacterium]|nr:fructose-6-phosphate aldolase [Planctomycetota bacterium]